MSDTSSAPVADRSFDEKRQQTAVVPVTPSQERDLGLPVQPQPRLRDQLRSINGFAVQWQGGDLRIPNEAFSGFSYTPPVPPPPMPELSSAAMALEPSFRPPNQPVVSMASLGVPNTPMPKSEQKMSGPTHMPAPTHMPGPTSQPIRHVIDKPLTPPTNNTPEIATVQDKTPILKQGKDEGKSHETQMDKGFDRTSAVPSRPRHHPQHAGQQTVFRHQHAGHKLTQRQEQQVNPAETAPALFGVRLTRADFGEQAIAYFDSPSAFSTDLSALDSIDNGNYYLSGFPDTHTYDVDGSTLLHTGNEICQVSIDDADTPTMLDVAWYKDSYCNSDGSSGFVYVFRTASQTS